jgi:hypothetical protein
MSPSGSFQPDLESTIY